jgi:pSer/pThr/pTyr-binding forkhead associated (FHA) protein
MGYLAAKEIPKRGQMPAGAGRYQPTAAVSFGMRRRHTAKQHPLAGQVFFLAPSEAEQAATIGRSESCQVTIPDESVSEFHCRMVVSPDGVFVIDVGSTNGTSVSLVQLEPNIPLQMEDEDVLSVGRYSFQLLRSRTLYDELSLLHAMEEFDGE